MLKNYLKIALRNLRKNKAYSLINVVGFAIGISVCILIFLYIQNELSYDKFFKNSDRIYRINTLLPGEGIESGAVYLLGPELKSEMSGIIQYARIYNFWGPATIGYSNKVFNEKNIFYADSTLFQVLSYKFIKGNKETAFQKPHSIVITESIAKKYFGDLNPINKILNLDNSFSSTI